MFKFIETTTFLITACIAFIYIYIKYFLYNYWKRYNIPHETPSIPFGNIPFSYFLGKISLGDTITNSYKKLKKYPFYGLYAFYKPAIVINDPELIKIILVKEFSSFPDRGWYSNEKVDHLSGQLFLIKGDSWKNLRGKLSPAFTSGKLKQMYDFLIQVCNQMINTCDSDLEKSDILEMKDIIARYTTDTISSIVFGHNCNSLKNPDTEFRRVGIEGLKFGQLNLILGMFLPEILQKFSLNLNNAEVQNFFLKLFSDMVDYRRKEKIVRKDFMNLLMQLMDFGEIENDENTPNISKELKKEKVEKLNLGEAVSQAFAFFLAGFETTSSTATYCLYELARNPDIQEKLQEEIDRIAESSNGLTYDSILEMEFLDMVFSETTRMYPSLAFLNRICTKDFKIPNSNYTIPNGLRVLIPVLGLQSDPKYYADPDKFDPERFTKENIALRNTSTYLAFGEGPRYCIGKRFGILQTKLAIVFLLRNYKFYVCQKTPIPIEYYPETFIQAPKTGVYLRVEKRKL